MVYYTCIKQKNTIRKYFILKIVILIFIQITYDRFQRGSICSGFVFGGFFANNLCFVIACAWTAVDESEHGAETIFSTFVRSKFFVLCWLNVERWNDGFETSAIGRDDFKKQQENFKNRKSRKKSLKDLIESLRQRKSYAGKRSCLRVWWKEKGRSRGIHNKTLTKPDRTASVLFILSRSRDIEPRTACDNRRWPFTRNGRPDTGRGESYLELPVQGDDNVRSTVRFLRSDFTHFELPFKTLSVSTSERKDGRNRFLGGGGVSEFGIFKFVISTQKSVPGIGRPNAASFCCRQTRARWFWQREFNRQPVTPPPDICVCECENGGPDVWILFNESHAETCLEI